MFSQPKAEEIIGCIVLIGVTMLDHEGKLVRQWQFYGEVLKADAVEGITVLLHGLRSGETYVLPPSTSAFVPAERGCYTLRTTREEVHDPDYLVHLTMRQRQQQGGGGWDYWFDL